MIRKVAIICVIMLITATNSFASSLNEINITNLVNAYLSAWETRDIKEIGKHYAENVSVYDLPSESTTKGKEAVLEFEREAWLASAPDMVWVKIGNIYITGNTAAYEWVYAGTYTGDWWGTIIENKPFSIKGISTTTFNSEGLIVFQKDFYDIKTLEAQLGVK